MIVLLCFLRVSLFRFRNAKVKVKIKVHTLDIAPLRIVNHHRRSAPVWHVFSRDFTVLPAHPHVHLQSEWAIPVFAFPAVADTHLPTRRDGRLSRPWCEVAPAEIRTCNLPIANPALYHTATSAFNVGIRWASCSYVIYTVSAKKVWQNIIWQSSIIC